MKKFLITLFLISVISFPLAYGHPFTTETDPLQASSAPVGITQVVVHYSEAIEIDFSELKVLDSNGDQIDNKDTKYFEGEESLVVTTSPLEDGVYTVTSKVLSKVDGHLVDYAFVFAVGDIVIDPELLEQQGTSETLFFPEAGARFPGLVGQTIVLGAIISSLLIWGTQRKNLIKDKLEQIQQTYHSKFLKITGFGLVIVLISNFLMLAVQAIRLQVPAFDAIQTSFGSMWVIRMIITAILFGIWFAMERKRSLSLKNQIPLLIASLVLISTTTLIGHGAASEQFAAITLDYVHNLVAAIWIGGVIYFGFTLLPTISGLDNEKKERFSLSLIPKFSIMIIISLGIVIISGPLLLWFLESDVGLLTESTYGMLILVKIAIAAVMITIGAYNQFKIQRKAEKNLNGIITVHKKLRNSLKIESALGIALLGVVALLANGTLPAGEVQQVDAQIQQFGFSTSEFSQEARFDIDISPFSSGQNSINVRVSDFDGNQLSDISGLKIKISHPQRNISPIEIPINEIKDDEGTLIGYQGDITFGFSGIWQIEVEAKRTQNANEDIIFNAIVKPKLSELKTEIIEYQFPSTDSKPLFPLYDGKDSIWISDPAKPRIWKFSIDDQEFSSFEYEGIAAVMLTLDHSGKLWFTDPPANKIGFIETQTEDMTIIDMPYEATYVGIASDLQNNIWVSAFDKNILLKYDTTSQEFEEFEFAEESGLFALLLDSEGKIWFTKSIAGSIGYINPQNAQIKEFTPKIPLQSPEALYIDQEENLWITEHTGLSIVKFNPILETFEKITVPNPDALPFGMTQDRYDNVWFAQHTIDDIAVYDPHNNNLIELPVPTAQSFVQFMTSDDKDNVWFVEQRGNKMGMIKITEVPNLGVVQEQVQKFELKYVELVSPLISLGIIATSLFVVKSIKDKRRINSLLE